MKAFLKQILSTTIGMLIGSVISFFLLLAVFTALTRTLSHGTPVKFEENSILHLKLRGQLVDKHRPLDLEVFGDRSIFAEDRTIGLYELNKAIDLAAKDKRVSGIYIELRDFDAGWAAVSALRRHLGEFSKSGKWIYAYGDRYDEKSYYLATVANQILIQPSGEIEFNGLAVNEAFLKGLFDKLELEPQVFRVGKFKAAIEPLILDRMSEENRRQNQELIGDIWAELRSAVAESRKLSPERVDAIASGLEAVSAQQAKTAGLVHELIFEDDVQDRMRNFTVGKGEEVRLVTAGQILRDQSSHSSSGKKIALIFAEGEITSGAGSSDSIGSETLREDILEATKDEDVAAVVLRVNSPGGDALASDVIWRQLMVTDRDIPVVVSMGDVAASGGYYIAAGARYIFAEPTTITGSIGVFGVMFNTEKFFRNKTGVKFDRVATHPYADIGNSNRPMTDVETKTIQGEVERVYTRFLDVVQEGRGYEKRADLESIAEGRVWSGVRAKQLGLVDELGGLDQALAKAAEYASLGADPEVEIFPRETDPFMQFIDRFSGDVESRFAKIALESVFGREIVQAGGIAREWKNGIYARLPSSYEIH